MPLQGWWYSINRSNSAMGGGLSAEAQGFTGQKFTAGSSKHEQRPVQGFFPVRKAKQAHQNESVVVLGITLFKAWMRFTLWLLSLSVNSAGVCRAQQSSACCFVQVE